MRQLRQAEVEDLHVAVPGDEDVVRLEIPVDDPFLVSRGHPVRDLHPNSTALSAESGPFEMPRGRLTFEQLRDDGAPASSRCRES